MSRVRDRDPYVDLTCKRIADHIYEYVNGAYSPQQIIQSVRYYDAFNVPYTDYPLLKVYRLAKQGSLKKAKTVSPLIISYSLVLPDLEPLAAIVDWVGDAIAEALREFQLEHQGCSPQIQDDYRADYRTLLNELTQRIHPFLRFSLTITEF